MKYSGVGGQAVMEGVMMRNGDKYAVAVRKPDKEIDVQVFDYAGPIKNKKLKNIPILLMPAEWVILQEEIENSCFTK